MVAVLVWVKFGRELPGICSGGGGGGVLLLCSGESLVLLLFGCLFVCFGRRHHGGRDGSRGANTGPRHQARGFAPPCTGAASRLGLLHQRQPTLG